MRLVSRKAVSGHALTNQGSAACRSPDHIEHGLRPGQHRNVAAGDLVDRGAHTSRRETLQLRMEGTVVPRDKIRAGRGPPGDAFGLLLQQVGRGWSVGRPEKPHLML